MKTSEKHNNEEAHTHEHHEHAGHTHEKHEHTEHGHEHHEHAKHEVKREAIKEEKIYEKASAKKTSGVPFLVLGIIIVVLLGVIITLLLRKPGTTAGPGTNTNTNVDAKDKVKVEFYVMSQCPYGTQVENGIGPVIESMGAAIDFRLDYIVTEASPGVFQSLHGEKEVKGNIVQLCAKSYYPDNYKWFKFILCQNKDAANVDTNWATCAQENGMDSNKLKTCLEGDEGKNLLRDSLNRASARQARGSQPCLSEMWLIMEAEMQHHSRVQFANTAKVLHAPISLNALLTLIAQSSQPRKALVLIQEQQMLHAHTQTLCL